MVKSVSTLKFPGKLQFNITHFFYREKFTEEAEQFCSMYDLISDGRKKREIHRKRKLQDMFELKEQLRKGLQTDVFGNRITTLEEILLLGFAI